MNNLLYKSSILVFLFTFAASQLVWNAPELWNAGLPASVQVFQTNSSFTSGIPMTAAYCKFNLSDPTLELKVVHSEGANLKTPLQYMLEEPAEVYMAINGGYFNMTSNQSMSLIIENNQVISSNMPNTTVSYQNGTVNTTYYPTGGAFGVYRNKTADVTWVYSIDNQTSDVYAYPDPSPNCFNCTPQPVPNATFPSGGAPWEVRQAVGAGPVLVKNGQIDLTIEQELIDAEIAGQRNPRSAICVTEDQEIIVLVVDGRYSLSAGLYLDELASLMFELGCKDALNLDGGGSSALVVNGFLTNRPSDSTGMRPVTSALLLVKKILQPDKSRLEQ